MNNAHLVVDTPQITCVNEPGRAVTRLVIRGNWDGRLRHQVSQTVRACVAEKPDALLVDVAGLDDLHGESAPTWRTAARFAEEAEPPVMMIVCSAGPGLRRRLANGVADRTAVAMAGSADAALASVPQLYDGSRRHHLSLPPQRSATVLARTMAGDACLAFGLGNVMHPVRLTVSELVANAVEHAGTDIDTWISVRGRVLHVGVQDRSPRLPRLLDSGPWHPGEPVEEPGTGLRVVAAAATAWGALPTRDGKLVWATFAEEPES